MSDAVRSTSGRLFYFAFGSNLLSTRLLERVGDCPITGAARLAGHRLSFRKRGRDGTGKCDVHPEPHPDATVWGALYEMTVTQKAVLDRIEGPGYMVAAVRVSTERHGALEAFTYRALPHSVSDGLAPFDWYLDFVVHGAREHALPDDYVAAVSAIEAVPDVDAERRTLNRAILDRGTAGARRTRIPG